MDDCPTYGENVKKEFTLDTDYCFVNHGAYGAVPKDICQQQHRYLNEMNSNPDTWYRSKRISLWNKARDSISQFVGADPSNLVFITNATTGINTALKKIPLKHGDGMLITNHTHLTVQNVCQEVKNNIEGTKLFTLEIPFPSVSEDDILEIYEKYFNMYPNIKVAVIDHVTCPTALQLPVKKLATLCRKYDVISIVDGAHAIGSTELNIEDLGVDIFIGNLHKWLFTPRGCAVFWIRRDHQTWCTPLITSISNIRDTQTNYFKQGTRDDIPFFIVSDAINFYHKMGGFDKISSYTSQLLDEATEFLSASFGTEKVAVPKSMESRFMRLVKLPYIPDYISTWVGCQTLCKDILTKYHLACSIYPVNGEKYLRLSANIYNTFNDYKRVNEVFLDLTRGHSK